MSGLLALERGSKTILVVFLVGTIDPRDELSDLFSLLELLEVDRLLRCLVSLRSVVFVRISRLRDLGAEFSFSCLFDGIDALLRSLDVERCRGLLGSGLRLRRSLSSRSSSEVSTLPSGLLIGF